MKTEPMFLVNWREGGAAAVFAGFETKPEDAAGHEILFAYYEYDNWEGDAFVLTRKDGKLFEVNGSHCSCYGLEGQWHPEETTAKALAHRLDKGRMGVDYDGRNKFAAELRAFLEIGPSNNT